MHGLGEHSGRYERFATALAGRGFSTFAVDLRGMGKSEGAVKLLIHRGMIGVRQRLGVTVGAQEPS